MKKPLEITTRMRFRDALRYNLYVAYSTTINRIFCILSVISLGMFIYSMVKGAAPVDQRFTQSFGLLIPPFIFFVTIPMKVWKATGALINTDLLKYDVTYIFTQDKIILKTIQGEAELTWDDYIKVTETKWDFRFFVDKVQAQVIPKYSLSKEQIEQLAQLIKLKKSKVK